MNLKLTSRMQQIADLAAGSDTVADIGTDHGYIPIWLLMNGQCRKAILSDVAQGPLQHARENAEKYLGKSSLPDLRLGSGLATLQPGEADTVIIAGMGGILMRDLLAAEPQTTGSVKRLVLQPRNNGAQLRKWIQEELSGFVIVREYAVREGRKYSEILCAVNQDLVCPGEDDRSRVEQAERYRRQLGISAEFDREVPCMYLADPTSYTEEYLHRRLHIEQEILRQIRETGQRETSFRRLSAVGQRVQYLEKMIEVYHEIKSGT